jgi:hypothetical protein
MCESVIAVESWGKPRFAWKVLTARGANLYHLAATVSQRIAWVGEGAVLHARNFTPKEGRLCFSGLHAYITKSRAQEAARSHTFRTGYSTSVAPVLVWGTVAECLNGAVAAEYMTAAPGGV